MSAKQLKKPTGRQLEARYEAVLAGHGSTARLARALVRHQSHLHRIWAGIRPVPDELVAIVELLEDLQRRKVPTEEWPERWRRELPDADPH